MKEKIDKFFLLLFCFIIIISSFFVGSPLVNNHLILSFLLNAIAFIYLCINMLTTKKKWTNNILSVAVLFLTISSSIPVIFKKYLSLSDSIESVLTYICLLSVFFSIKEIKMGNKKKYITFSIIISAVIICLIGFDNLTYNFFENILKKFGNANFVNPDKRMISIFGYSNAFAIYVGIALILLLDEYKKEKKEKLEFLQISLLTFFIICILLSFSRGTWLCLVVIMCLNMFLEKEKAYKYKQLNVLISSTIISLIYVKIYNELYISKLYLDIYICLLIFMLMSIAINQLLKLLKNKIKIKHTLNLKQQIILISVIFILAVIICIILSKFTKPLVLFDSLYDNNEYIQNINYIKDKDGKYDIEIDVESHSSLINNYAYEIIFIEKNEYNDDVEEHSILLNNEKGIKKLSFEKQDDTKYLSITYRSLYKSERRGLIINYLVINGKNIALNYKYLPTKIVEKIKNSNKNNSSINERFVYIRDGFKVILKHPILGQGGNAWDYAQLKVQEYKYYAKEVHSYPIEIWMEFGIVGFLSLILIIFYVIKSIKDENKKDFCIVILLLLLHSFFDFGMSFFIIQLIFFVLLACISTEEKNEKTWTNFIVLIIILIGLIGNSLNFNSDTIYQNYVYNKENKIKEAIQCIKIYPFNINAREYILNEELYFGKYINKNSNIAEDQFLEKNILYFTTNEQYRDCNLIIEVLAKQNRMDEYTKIYDLIYEIAKREDENTSFKIDDDIERFKIIKDLESNLNKDSEQKEKYENLINHEKAKIIKEINDKKTRLTKEQKENYLQEIKKE